MTDKKVDRVIIKLEKYKVELSKSKEKSRQFFVDVGILTPQAT